MFETITASHQHLILDDPGQARRELAWATPMSWNVIYGETNDIVVASDLNTGLYAFEISDEQQPIYSIREAVDTKGDGNLAKAKFHHAMSYWTCGETVPNTGPARSN